MKILFAGSPDIAVPALDAVAGSFDVCAVLTNPDRTAGRGKRKAGPPVKAKAESLGLPVLQPESLNSDFRAQISQLKPDVLVVVAYGKIFGPKFLSLFPLGGINLHPSLLPQYRGPAPLPAAILNGETETGVTIQRIGRAMDSGDIIAQKKFSIEETDTTGTLVAEAAALGAGLLTNVLHDIENGRVQSKAQDDGKATYCRLIEKSDGCIDWHRSAVHISRMVRAYNPWPTAYTMYKGKKLAILKSHVYRGNTVAATGAPGLVAGVDTAEGILIQTKSGILAVEQLQLQSRKALEWKAFLNGTADFAGSMLGGE